MDSNQPHQFKAKINRREIVLGRAAQAIREQRFDIGFKLDQRWIGSQQAVPTSGSQRRFDGASRAGVHNDDSLRGNAKKRQIDGQRQRLPLPVADLESGQRVGISRNEFPSADDILEAQSAGIARANDLPGGRFKQMPMGIIQGRAAEFAILGVIGSLRDPPQSSEEASLSGAGYGGEFAGAKRPPGPNSHAERQHRLSMQLIAISHL